MDGRERADGATNVFERLAKILAPMRRDQDEALVRPDLWRRRDLLRRDVQERIDHGVSRYHNRRVLDAFVQKIDAGLPRRRKVQARAAARDDAVEFLWDGLSRLKLRRPASTCRNGTLR